MPNIVQSDDQVLRQTAKPVLTGDFGSAELNKILASMSKALAKEADGVAIAAPQIGVSLRIFVVSGKAYQKDFEREQGLTPPPDKVFINPKFTKKSRNKVTRDEGCLSCRWLYGKTRRADKATVEAYDENGKRFTQSGSGLMAQIFQHEIDHLDGILFIDHATDLQEIEPEKIK